MHAEELAAPLSPKTYWQPEWLEQERETVFYRSWIFAGFTQDLPHHDSYLSLNVCGTPVIVRNGKDGLVAFQNICSHRHALIHAKGRGRASFRCGFHGWTFNAEGIPVGITDNTQSFGFDKEDRCRLALRPVAVETCGHFIFVRLAPEGASLKDWLGPVTQKLKDTSNLFTTIYGRIEQNWASNWKIGIEVTLEGYHLPYVHPNSFSSSIKPASDVPLDMKIAEPYGRTEYNGIHSSNVSLLSDASGDVLEEIARGFHLPQAPKPPVYDYFFIYPNCMISVTGGIVACVESYNPISADKTEAQWWLMIPPPGIPGALECAEWKDATGKLTTWTESVMSEDRAICETFQRGVRYAERNGYLGRAEERVRHLQSFLLKDVGRVASDVGGIGR